MTILPPTNSNFHWTVDYYYFFQHMAIYIPSNKPPFKHYLPVKNHTLKQVKSKFLNYSENRPCVPAISKSYWWRGSMDSILMKLLIGIIDDVNTGVSEHFNILKVC